MFDVEFDNLRGLHLLWLALLAALAGAWAFMQRRRARRILASVALLPRLTTPAGLLRSLSRLALVSAALGLLAVAIADPRWGEQEQRVGTRGIDVMVLLDASRSMLAGDVSPSRLERAKVAITQDLLPRLAGDRIGLIAFAGVASVKCPLTNDYGFFRLALDDVSPDTMPQGGSLIGDAIRQAATGFDNAPNTHKVVLLITDGEDQDSFPVEAARKLWDDRKIPIVSLALGDEREGARIPVGGGKSDFMTFRGEVVHTKARFDQLRQIAALSNLHGFVPVGTQDFDLGEIYRQRIVPAMRAATEVDSQIVKRPSHYHEFALAALILLLVETFTREAPRRPATRNTVAGAASPLRSTNDRRPASAAVVLILVAAEALAVPARAQTSQPSERETRAALEAGNRLMAEGKYSEARAEYEKAAEDTTAPFQAEILHDLASACFKLNDFDRARELWMRAASLKDAKFEAAARYNLGNCRHTHAVELYQRAFSEQSREARKKMEEAVADLDQALAYYRDALKLRDTLADARANLELAATLRAKIVEQLRADCNENGIPDAVELQKGEAQDCNQNGILDECDIRRGTSTDCDKNRVADECQDCNKNGIPDAQDIAAGTSQDCNKNCIPDECEKDCNKNGLPDDCDIRDGLSQDCNKNGIPDECETDCNKNGIPDDCDIRAKTSGDCNKNGIPDECEDCNNNGIPDVQDIAAGTSKDCNKNCTPDECEPDCNKNGIPDSCDIRDGTSADCDKNGVPDECQDCNKNNVPDAQDIAAGTSQDCNKNCIPDECETDCNQNHIPDDCDIRDGTSKDENNNHIPDECENKPQSQPASQPDQKQQDQQKQDQQKQDQQKQDQQQQQNQQQQDQQKQDQQQQQKGEQSGDQKQQQGEKKDGQQEEQQQQSSQQNQNGDNRNENASQPDENRNQNQNQNAPGEQQNAANRNENANSNQNGNNESQEQRKADEEAQRRLEDERRAAQEQKNQKENGQQNSNSAQAATSQPAQSQPAQSQSATMVDAASQPANGLPPGMTITLTREQAERLLQKIRDVERQRRQEKLRREAGRYRPAEKDW